MRSQACNNLGPTRFIAPSPSGKAPDSDSGIGGSNPSGAAKHRRSDLTIGPFLLPDDPTRQPPGMVRTNHCRTKGAQGSAAGAPPCRNGRAASARQTGRQAPLPEPGHPAWHHPGRPCTDAAAAARLLAREEGHAAPAKLPDPAPKDLPCDPARPGHERRVTMRTPETTKARHGRAFEAGAPANRTQQTRWISAWRTGSRDGPCADRPSYARLRGRHGS